MHDIILPSCYSCVEEKCQSFFKQRVSRFGKRSDAMKQRISRFGKRQLETTALEEEDPAKDLATFLWEKRKDSMRQRVSRFGKRETEVSDIVIDLDTDSNGNEMEKRDTFKQRISRFGKRSTDSDIDNTFSSDSDFVQDNVGNDDLDKRGSLKQRLSRFGKRDLKQRLSRFGKRDLKQRVSRFGKRLDASSLQSDMDNMESLKQDMGHGEDFEIRSNNAQLMVPMNANTDIARINGLARLVCISQCTKTSNPAMCSRCLTVNGKRVESSGKRLWLPIQLYQAQNQNEAISNYGNSVDNIMMMQAVLNSH